MRIIYLLSRIAYLEIKIRTLKWQEARTLARINLIKNRLNLYNEIHL